MESSICHLSALWSPCRTYALKIPCDRTVPVSNPSLGNEFPEMPLRSFLWACIMLAVRCSGRRATCTPAVLRTSMKGTPLNAALLQRGWGPWGALENCARLNVTGYRAEHWYEERETSRHRTWGWKWGEEQQIRTWEMKAQMNSSIKTLTFSSITHSKWGPRTCSL